MVSPWFLPTPWSPWETSLKSFNYESFHDRSFGVASRLTRLLAPAALGILALLATGCATRSSVDRLRADVANLRTELHHLSQAQQTTASELSRALAESRPMAARTLEVASAVQEITAEVARLRVRVEAVEAEAREAKVKAAVTPPAVPSPPPASVPARPPVLLSPPAPTPSRVAPRAASAPPRGDRPREPAPRAENPEQVYSAALSTFRAREHGQAVLDFLDFIAKHPGHPLVANAQYWIGEAYYVQRDYRQAMTEFQKVLQTAPGSAKAADALLKIGLCQRHLRDEARARLTWQRVIREFPQSESATKARAFLEPGTARR